MISRVLTVAALILFILAGFSVGGPGLSPLREVALGGIALAVAALL